MRCPNKKDPAFKELIEKHGELEAYALYIENDFEIPDVKTIDESSLGGLDLISATKLKSVTDLSDKILASLISKERYYSKHKNEGFSKKLTDQIDKFEKASITKRFLLYVNNIDSVISQFKAAQKASKYDLKMLNEMNDYMSTYDYLDDIINEIKANDITVFENKTQYLNELKGRVNDLKQNYTHYVREIMIDKMAANMEEVRADHRYKLEKQFLDDNPRGQSTLSKSDYDAAKAKYINDNVELLNTKIQLETKAHVRKLMTLAPRDIGAIAKMFRDGRSISDPVIRYASTILDNAAFDTRKSFAEDFAQAEQVVEKFLKASNHSTITDHKKLYENMIEIKDGEYTGYYSREFYNDFYPEFYKDKKELMERLDKSKKEGEQELAIKQTNEFKNKYYEDTKYSIHELEGIKKEYKNPQFDKMTSAQKEAYNYLILFNHESDALTPGNKLNYRLPAINKLGYERLTEGDIVKSTQDYISDSFKLKAYDTDLYGDLGESDGKVRQLASQGKHGFKSIAIPFRGNIQSKDQSYDLFGMALKNRYAALTFSNNSKVKESLDALLHVAGERDLVNHSGGRTLLNVIERLGVSKEEMIEIEDSIKGYTSNSYAALASILEDRLYGKHNIPSNWGDISIDKMSNALIKFAANSTLIFNVGSASANTLSGKIMNFFEAVKGIHFDRKNLRYGDKAYFNDFSNNVADVGAIRQRSKTNQLSAMFYGEAGMFEGMGINASQSSRVKRLLSTKTLHGLNTTAEHYISGTLMYSVLNNIKVIDRSTGRYVTSSGALTDSRDEAMGMDQGYSLSKKGVYEFNHNWTVEGHAVVNDLAEQAISRKLITILANLQGNYDPTNKAMVQRYWYGKQAMFLRKWIVKGLDRRWRGGANMFKDPATLELHQRRYNENTGEFEEGTYVTSIRFFKNMIKGAKEFQFQVASLEWNKLTDSEKANIRSAVSEMLIMLGAFASSTVLALLAGKIDDDDEELKNTIYFLAYVTRRAYGELMFYVPVNPNEALRILSTPAATMSTIESITRLTNQILSDLFSFEFEKYKSGANVNKIKSVNLANNIANPLRHLLGASYEKKFNHLVNSRNY